MTIEPASPSDADAIEVLLDEAFGPARHLRTAYRLREGARATLALVQRHDDRVVGSLQCWPISLVQPSRRSHPLTMLGPVAVAADARGRGVGTALIEHALAHLGDVPAMLIGDAAYYGRFGFTANHTGQWSLPGPVERERLLARGAAALPRLAEICRASPLARAA